MDQQAGAVAAEDALPPYIGIDIRDVHMVVTPEQAVAARDALLACDAIGFDTESKPTFTRGETSTGPHLIQFATDDKAWLFQIGASADPHTLAVLKAILEPPAPLDVPVLWQGPRRREVGGDNVIEFPGRRTLH